MAPPSLARRVSVPACSTPVHSSECGASTDYFQVEESPRGSPCCCTMTKGRVLGLFLLLGIATMTVFYAARESGAAARAERLVVHNVFFTLKDDSAEARQKLVAACDKYLTSHPGTVFFAAGTLAEDFK